MKHPKSRERVAERDDGDLLVAEWGWRGDAQPLDPEGEGGAQT